MASEQQKTVGTHIRKFSELSKEEHGNRDVIRIKNECWKELIPSIMSMGGAWGVSPQRTSCCAHLKSLTFHIIWNI
jgi:hypothetical protein